MGEVDLPEEKAARIVEATRMCIAVAHSEGNKG